MKFAKRRFSRFQRKKAMKKAMTEALYSWSLFLYSYSQRNKFRWNLPKGDFPVFKEKKLWRRQWQKLCTVDLFFFTVTLSVTNSDEICQKENVCFNILPGYLCFSFCKQLVVSIHFTGLPKELREIISSLKMCAKQS